MNQLKFTLTYDEAPRSLNAGGAGSRSHWSKGYKEKSRWEGIYAMLLLAERVPRGMARASVSASLAFTTPNQRRDVENYRPAISKPFADALVKGLWLPDDTAEFFEMTEVSISPEKLSHPNPAVKGRITIYLTANFQEVPRPAVAFGRTQVG